MQGGDGGYHGSGAGQHRPAIRVRTHAVGAGLGAVGHLKHRFVIILRGTQKSLSFVVVDNPRSVFVNQKSKFLSSAFSCGISLVSLVRAIHVVIVLARAEKRVGGAVFVGQGVYLAILQLNFGGSHLGLHLGHGIGIPLHCGVGSVDVGHAVERCQQVVGLGSVDHAHCFALFEVSHRSHVLPQQVGNEGRAVSGGVVGVSALCDALHGVLFVNIGICLAVSLLFVEEGDGVVGLHNHGGIGRADVACLMAAVPIGGKGRHVLQVAERGEFLIVDAHVGASAAEGHGLESEVHFGVVRVALHGEDEYFAVGRVARCVHTIRACV